MLEREFTLGYALLVRGIFRLSQHLGPEANTIKKKDKLLCRFIPYFTCKIWKKTTK